MGDSMNQFENPDSPTVLLRRLHRWRMAFFGLVILLAGMLTGAAVALLVVGHVGRAPRPPGVPPASALLTQVIPRLRLSPEQTKRVEPIVQRHYQRLDAIRQEGRTAIMEELKLMNEEMFAVLSEQQARLWERLLQGLPGQIRHMPEPYGPGGGRGPGFRRRAGPPGTMREPAPPIPPGPLPPETNAPPHR